MIRIEVENRSGAIVDEAGARDFPRDVIQSEGVAEGDLGVSFVGPEESRALKAEHLGLEEATDVLSVPIDGRGDLPAGVPRQLGDVVLCPQVVGEAWRGALVHGLLHLLGYDHGADMERREAQLLA